MCKILLFCSVIFSSSILQANEEQESLGSDPVSGVEALYHVKVSFIRIPIKASISIEQKTDANDRLVYEATMSSKSSVIEVKQTERARLSKCTVALEEIVSKGNRIGANSWHEKVKVNYDQESVSYWKNLDRDPKVYLINEDLTGFATLFAHQYASIKRGEKNKNLRYTQTNKEVYMPYKVFDELDKIKLKISGKKEKAFRTVFENEKKIPTIWYMPDIYGPLPVKIAFRIGFVKIDVSLAEINKTNDEIRTFFEPFACG